MAQTEIKYRDYGDSNGDLVVVCGFRLFLNGVDVSDHVTGSISWSHGGRGSENSLTFTLDNNNSKFELRPSNLGMSETQDAAKSFADADSFATTQPWKLDTLKVHGNPSFITSGAAESRGLVTYSESAKKAMYLDKIKKRVRLDDATGSEYKLKSYMDPTTGRWTQTASASSDISLFEGLFHTKASIINVMDQVRFYVMDPNRDPVDEITSLWIPAFTGFVMSAPPEHDFSTGSSSITVTCSDIRTLLKRKRMLVNAATADQITPTIGSKSGLFADSSFANSTTSNALADQSLTFEKLIALVLMGVRLADGDTSNSKISDYCRKRGQELDAAWANTRSSNQPQGQNRGGFGSLWFGYYYEYDTSLSDNKSKLGSGDYNEKRSEFMNDWNRLCTFGALNSDSRGICDYLDWSQMQMQGTGTKLGGHHSALKSLVHFLVPSGGNQVASLLDRTFIDQLGVQREYMSVGEIIEQVCERIDYQVSVTGAGDIVFEFPMYDFLPHDMGKEFRNVCAVSDSVKNHTINDEANSNPINALKVTGGYNDQQQSIMPGNEQVQNYLFTAYVAHDLLINRYGLSIEETQIPFLSSGPHTAMSDGQFRRTLVMFACIEFLKRMMEMSSLSISGCYNPFLRPNRPYYYNYGRRLSITENIQHTLALFQNADTQVDSKYVRRVHDITGDIISFSGSIGLPFRYSNKNSVDVFLSDANFNKFVNDLSLSGINIYIPDSPSGDGFGNASVGTNFRSLANTSLDRRVCAWSQADKEAFDNLCREHGAAPRDVMMVLVYESALNTGSVNKDTYAAGLNQMMPSSILDTLNGDPELRAKYPGCERLLDKKFQARSRKGGVYVPKTSREEFNREYFDVFGTPAAQLDMYNAYLKHTKAMSGVGNDYKFDSVEKLTAAQMKPGKLKATRNGGDIPLTPSEQAVNPGITSTNQYGALIRQKYDPQADALLSSMASGCSDMLGASTTTSTASQDTPRSTTSFGGAGLSPLVAMPKIANRAPTSPPTQIITPNF